MRTIIYWAYHWSNEDERTMKTIGHFSSDAKARAAIEAVKGQPGFAEKPDGFDIDEVELDRVCWAEGFVDE